MGAAIAKLEVGPRGVTLHVHGEQGARHLDPGELQQAIVSRQAVRGYMLPAAPPGRERYEPLLRAVGRLLARAPGESYELVVAPEIIVARDSTGGLSIFLVQQLAALARALAQQHRQGQQADSSDGYAGV
jgi:hypothetical protein